MPWHASACHPRWPPRSRPLARPRKLLPPLARPREPLPLLKPNLWRPRGVFIDAWTWCGWNEWHCWARAFSSFWKPRALNIQTLSLYIYRWGYWAPWTCNRIHEAPASPRTIGWACPLAPFSHASHFLHARSLFTFACMEGRVFVNCYMHGNKKNMIWMFSFVHKYRISIIAMQLASLEIFYDIY
jgi:hypothetical protein